MRNAFLPILFFVCCLALLSACDQLPQNYLEQSIIEGNAVASFSYNLRPYKRRVVVRVNTGKGNHLDGYESLDVYLDGVVNDVYHSNYKEVNHPVCPRIIRSRSDVPAGFPVVPFRNCSNLTRSEIGSLINMIDTRKQTKCTYDPKRNGVYFNRRRKEEEKYTVGRCYMRGKDIALGLIKKGLVRVKPFHEEEPVFLVQYREVEAQARKERVGLWGKCCVK